MVTDLADSLANMAAMLRPMPESPPVTMQTWGCRTSKGCWALGAYYTMLVGSSASNVPAHLVLQLLGTLVWPEAQDVVIARLVGQVCGVGLVLHIGGRHGHVSVDLAGSCYSTFMITTPFDPTFMPFWSPGWLWESCTWREWWRHVGPLIDRQSGGGHRAQGHREQWHAGAHRR